MTRETITPAMKAMIRASWDRCDHRDSGFGVELYGSGAWCVARVLQRAGLGWIEGGRPQGSDLPGLFFANRDAGETIGLFDDNDDGEAEL